MYCIQPCFICRPIDSTMAEEDGIEPRTIVTSALAVRRSNHSSRSHPPIPTPNISEENHNLNKSLCTITEEKNLLLYRMPRHISPGSILPLQDSLFPLSLCIRAVHLPRQAWHLNMVTLITFFLLDLVSIMYRRPIEY